MLQPLAVYAKTREQNQTACKRKCNCLYFGPVSVTSTRVFRCLEQRIRYHQPCLKTARQKHTHLKQKEWCGDENGPHNKAEIPDRTGVEKEAFMGQTCRNLPAIDFPHTATSSRLPNLKATKPKSKSGFAVAGNGPKSRHLYWRVFKGRLLPTKVVCPTSCLGGLGVDSILDPTKSFLETS